MASKCDKTWTYWDLAPDHIAIARVYRYSDVDRDVRGSLVGVAILCISLSCALKRVHFEQTGMKIIR